MPGRAREFREQLSGRKFLADGAMGTLLHARGIPIENCFDELNLSAPEMVMRVHREYVEAGAQILRTNTFGANRARLAHFGLAEKVADINRAGVKLARDAGQNVYVAGAIGPSGASGASEQVRALCEAGVDLLILETFTDLKELRRAAFDARDAAGVEMVVVAQVALVRSLSGEAFAREANAWPVDVIGFNCTEAAATMAALRVAAGNSQKLLSAFPSAGLPGNLASPEALAKYARQMLEAGVKIIGGCCGTTPEYIEKLL